MKRLSLAVTICLVFIVGHAVEAANSFDSIKSAIREKTLSNGMKIIVMEQHDVPVISFHVYADVGSAQEVDGITGISHLLEHLAFKGTKTVGTKNYDAEVKLLDQIDTVYNDLAVEKNKKNSDKNKIAELSKKITELEKDAKEYVINNEYFDMTLREGDDDVNAYTSTDATRYINALPSNRLEFWMSLSSDRFLNPVFREFYKEKDVVMEERRLSLENRPQRRLIEDFYSTAFKAHPYKHSVVGHMSDLEKITRSDVKNYFKKYYSPNNLTAAIVGDVDADEVFRMAEVYFGRIPSGPSIEPVRTVEPEQWGERRVQVSSRAEPMLIVGYHRPSSTHEDAEAVDALAYILGEGRTSRLFERLVKVEKKAAYCATDASTPGEKYPSLMAIIAVPGRGSTTAESLSLIDSEIEKIQKESVSKEEIGKYKSFAKKAFVERMKNNSSMAALLAQYSVLRGDWRELFGEIARIERLTPEDIKRVANLYLKKTNRTVGEIVSEQTGKVK